MSVVTVLQWLS
uniref:Uncharacterized protein n=1 Tax=Arundo donax TaxID=35708 RepID=A0A0A9AA75_ARUDO